MVSVPQRAVPVVDGFQVVERTYSDDASLPTIGLVLVAREGGADTAGASSLTTIGVGVVNRASSSGGVSGWPNTSGSFQ
jgi:hypothetical protein